MSRTKIKHLILHGAATLCMALVVLTTACTETIDTSARYVFTERTIASYLEDHSQFSEYLRLLKEQRVSDVSETTVYQLMTAYGYYTCFAPTNEASSSIWTPSSSRASSPKPTGTPSPTKR